VTGRKREKNMQVGVIGVGRMGKAMARNLLKAGHSLHIFDTAKEPLAELEKEGAVVATNMKDAFRGDAVISMLPNDDAMRAVFVHGGVLPQGGSSTVHVNMATASVACAEELTALHIARGVPYVAATVWGRPDAAAAAKLSIAVAGDAKAIDRIQPLLDVIGQRSTRVGDEPRMANVAKIAGNLMVASAIEAMAEAAALVRGYKMSSADFLNIIVTALFDVPFTVATPNRSRAESMNRPASISCSASRMCGWHSLPARRQTYHCHLPMRCATPFSTPLPMGTPIKIGPQSPRSRHAAQV